jgi:hypothetical protein
MDHSISEGEEVNSELRRFEASRQLWGEVRGQRLEATWSSTVWGTAHSLMHMAACAARTTPYEHSSCTADGGSFEDVGFEATWDWGGCHRRPSPDSGRATYAASRMGRGVGWARPEDASRRAEKGLGDGCQKPRAAGWKGASRGIPRRTMRNATGNQVPLLSSCVVIRR